MTGNGHNGNPGPKQRVVFLAIASVFFCLIACGSPAPTPNIPIAPTATQPAPTQPLAATPAPTPTEPPATPAPNRDSGATPTPPPATRAANPAPTATAQLTLPPPTATQPPATATPAPAATPAENVAASDVADIRRIVYDYWVALNDYDVDLALTMLEDGYRAQEEEAIRNDIGSLKLFRAKLEVSEETPPTLNADGDYETYLTIGTPVDTRRVMMVFRRIDGQWRIIFSGEVE